MTTPAPFLSRHLGDYLLVAQLSEDALGTVFRALYAADERRFVRLRILQSAELSRDTIERTIRENALRGVMVHDAIVPRALLDEVEGIPFLTWDETAGWTLDTMLSRVRAFGIRIPAEYALLITERIAAALEHAHQTLIDGRPADHGLLWPGFVSISHDAAVRVGGFGVADGVLPAMQSARLTAEIGPYLAPEVRHGGPVGANSDVYSLGAILIELLTGRRPSLETPSAELRAGDPRSEELETFLGKCLAPAETRFESAIDAHRALQQMVTGNPFSLYTANLALFLYKLLNPESQSVAPSSDWESTNPVVVHGVTQPAAADVPPPLPAPGTPRRRRGDAVVEDSPPVESEAEAAPALALEAPTPAEPAACAEPIADLSEVRRRSLPPLPALARAWARPFSALAAAAGVAVGAFLVASQIQSARGPVQPESATIEASVPAPAPPPAAPDPAQVVVPALAPAPAAPAALPASTRAAARHAKKVHPELRQPTENLRLKAALARIEADRLNARESAGEIFGEGRASEQEGERLLRERDYDAAQLAFGRAARLFEQAQELSWEERFRHADLARGNTLPGEPSAR
jgi:serine/threonine-protein kinase